MRTRGATDMVGGSTAGASEVISWFVSGDALLTRRRQGGANAQTGHEYQRTYALFRTVNMLDPESNIAAVRWEGAQDVDIAFGDGRQLHIQTKNEADARLSVADIADSLTGFALDLLDANDERLSFLLVTRTGTFDAATRRLRAHAASENDVRNIRSQLTKRSERIARLHADDQVQLVQRLIARLGFEPSCGHEVNGLWSFEAFSNEVLQRCGVRDDKKADLRNAIYRLFTNRRVVTKAQVVDLAAPYLAAARKPAAMQPGLTRAYVFRPQVHASAIDFLANGDSRIITVLRGMGGSGKTTLATALAEDPLLKERFPDGVLWCVLGQTPDRVAQINSMLGALGESSIAGNAQSASALLRSVLAARSCLVVIDDVWRREDADLVLPSSGLSRALVTTRDRSIATQLEAHTVEVGAMLRKESLRLLTRIVGESGSLADEEDADRFASRVGDLPLALQLGGIRAQEGTPFADLVTELDSAELRLRALDSDLGEVQDTDLDIRRLRSLEACFDLSLRRLSSEARTTFFSLAIVREDTSFDGVEAALIAGSSDTAAAIRDVRLLHRKAILLAGDSIRGEGWKFHDLVLDYARTAYGSRRSELTPVSIPTSLSAAHSAFLDRCKPDPDSQWATAPDLDYVDRNLAWHAEMACRPQVLQALVQELADGRPSWLSRLQRKGLTSIVQMTAARAIDLATSELNEPGSQGGASPLWNVAFAATAHACLVSKANKLAAPLVARFVKEGAWSAAEGLAQIRLTSGLARIWSLGWLLPHLPEHLRNEVENELFALLISGIYPAIRDRTALGAIAPHASKALCDRLLQHAQSQSAALHALVLSHVIRREPLQDRSWLEAFESANPVLTKDNFDAITHLLENGIVLTHADAGSVWELARSTGGLKPALSRRLLSLLPDELIDEAIEILVSAPDSSELLGFLHLPAALPSVLVLRALRSCARKFHDPLTVGWILGMTVGCLPEAERAGALAESADILETVSDTEWRKVLALTDVSVQLENPLRTELERKGLLSAAAVGFHSFGAMQMERLTLKLTDVGVALAIDLIVKEDEATQMRHLPYLLARSTGEAASLATNALLDATRRRTGYSDFATCIEVLPADQLFQLLQASTRLKLEPSLAKAVASICSALGEFTSDDLTSDVSRAWTNLEARDRILLGSAIKQWHAFYTSPEDVLKDLWAVKAGAYQPPGEVQFDLVAGALSLLANFAEDAVHVALRGAIPASSGGRSSDINDSGIEVFLAYSLTGAELIQPVIDQLKDPRRLAKHYGIYGARHPTARTAALRKALEALRHTEDQLSISIWLARHAAVLPAVLNPLAVSLSKRKNHGAHHTNLLVALYPLLDAKSQLVVDEIVERFPQSLDDAFVRVADLSQCSSKVIRAVSERRIALHEDSLQGSSSL